MSAVFEETLSTLDAGGKPDVAQIEVFIFRTYAAFKPKRTVIKVVISPTWNIEHFILININFDATAFF